MSRKKHRPYFLLGIFLFCLFYLPGVIVEGLRGGVGTLSSGFWKKGRVLQASFVQASNPKKGKDKTEALEVENLLLKKQNESLRRRLFSEERVEYQLKKLKELISLDEKKSLDFFKRRRKAAEELLDLELFSVQAEVIRRDIGEWNSTLWINVGNGMNDKLGRTTISVGSPVLKGPYLIGVIEQVNQNKSRVRLLTDPSLVPSVRVARGGTNEREFGGLVKQVYNQAVIRGERRETLLSLSTLLQTLQEEKEEYFFAKGELIGSSSPFCRFNLGVLRGVGFNYDFGDQESAPLELRSGKEIKKLSDRSHISLIEVGDLLITTGMDGTFPRDLPVAHVTYVAPLKEGSPSYEIEAKLCAGNLETLLDVSILPPPLSQ
jgi:cell shape-determining protein MreC